jgi:hypothetical protein
MLSGRERRLFLTGGLGALGGLALVGCSGAAANTPAAPSPTLSSAQVIPPAATTAQVGLQINSDTRASVIQRPETFMGAYNALASGSLSAADNIRSALGSMFQSLDDSAAAAVYASVVAHNVAPIGQTSLAPLTATLSQLLNSPALACGHYCKLASLLAFIVAPQLIPPDQTVNGAAKPSLHVVVWEPNVPIQTGVHSELVLANVLDGAYLLIDPMYAFALRIPYVGSGPQSGLTVIENAATMMQSPIASSNVAILDPAGQATQPNIIQDITSGAMGPQYIYHDALFGSEGWDIVISQTFNNMGYVPS